MGLILLILPLIKDDENKAIVSDKTSIGSKANGSKENANPKEKVFATSKLATSEIVISSIEATAKEIRHWTKEW